MRRRVAVGIVVALVLGGVTAGEKQKEKRKPGDPRLTAQTLEGLAWRGIGPALMSGRIADIVIHPSAPATRYIAVGSGGVWKTTNSGTTWAPIFDDQGSYSIGCVTLDPRQPETVWVGTGENVGGRHVGFGDGIYRSRDGGANWEHLGLGNSEHIGKIIVDPRDSNVVYVAAQGPLWSAGGDRGLFKTVDGGKTWSKILGGADYTGVNEVALDPRHPDVLWATTHQRFRNVAALINGGPESGIHKSTDGGKSWRKLAKGLPEDEMGKIGLAVSPQNPDVIYAAIELAHRKGGVWRSADGGESWEKRSDRVAGGTGPHYYQEIFASPHQFDRLYFMDVRLRVSEDGGKTWRSIDGESKHVDNHALAFLAKDPEYLLAGCDGGLYESWDLGQTWKFTANLPLTQIYKVAIDNDRPFYNVYGGTQDNNTQGGPSRTDNVNGIRNSDWFITVYADGHQPAVDPINPDIVYSQSQGGNLMRFDRKTGELVYIQPQPGADEPSERFNWDSPILVSPHDPKTLFFASQRIWRSDDRGDSWRPLSADLTRDLDRQTLPVMGRVQSWDALWDLSAMSEYGTITALSQSPRDEKLIWAGTDDGRIQVTDDGGATWRKIERLPGVRDFFFVNDIKADRFDVDTAYVVVDQHKSGNFEPYVFKTQNRGRTWTSIAGNLPKRHLVWRLVQDPVRPDLLFVGTEFGVFFTIDRGRNWVALSGGAPTIAFRDLAIQERENDLVGASFGRGFFILDDYSPLRQISEELLGRDAVLFGVRSSPWYVERRPLGQNGQATQGNGFFSAPNPPFGAVFTYYLRDDVQSRRERRREREKEAIEKDDDTPYPGWEEIRREREEEDPAIVLTVRDTRGQVVRRLIGPAKAGIHRIAWDLHYPTSRPWEPSADAEAWPDPTRDRGFLAPPGTYIVEIAKRIDGKIVEFGLAETFEVAAIRAGSLAGASPSALSAFWRRVEVAQRAAGGAGSAIDEVDSRLAAIREVLDRSAASAGEVDSTVRDLEHELRGLRLRLRGDEDREARNDPGPMSIARRLDVAVYGNTFSTYGPTPTHEQSLAIAERQLDDLLKSLDHLIQAALPDLDHRLNQIGIPWTPGRSAPQLKQGE